MCAAVCVGCVRYALDFVRGVDNHPQSTTCATWCVTGMQMRMEKLTNLCIPLINASRSSPAWYIVTDLRRKLPPP